MEQYSSDTAKDYMLEFLESFDVPSESDESRTMLKFVMNKLHEEEPLESLMLEMFQHYFRERPWSWLTPWYRMAEREMSLRENDYEY